MNQTFTIKFNLYRSVITMYENIVKSKKFIKVQEFFNDKIKLLEPQFHDLLIEIYTENLLNMYEINAYIENNTIYLYPALFMIDNDPKIKIKFEIEHIIAIIGHELGHYIHNHLKQD